MSDICEYCGVQGTLRKDLELRPAPNVEGITVIACIDQHACDDRCLLTEEDDQ